MSSDIIAVVKVKIQEKKNIPFDKQRLAFCCKPLEDGRTLESYSIIAGSTIFITGWPNGGGLDDEEDEG
eukprot:6387182-Heterocapsa_arctica.AAC.1